MIISEQGKESPFLMRDIFEGIGIDMLCIDELSIPKSQMRHYLARVENTKSNNQREGTYIIRQDLKANNYRWDSRTKSWIKPYSVDTFSIKRLMKESWVEKGVSILLTITDEFDNEIHKIEISFGKETIVF